MDRQTWLTDSNLANNSNIGKLVFCFVTLAMIKHVLLLLPRSVFFGLPSFVFNVQVKGTLAVASTMSMMSGSEADAIQKFESIDGVPSVKPSAPRRRVSIFSDGEYESWTFNKQFKT